MRDSSQQNTCEQSCSQGGNTLSLQGPTRAVKLWVGLVLWNSRGLREIMESERCSCLVVAASSKCARDASSVGVQNLRGWLGWSSEHGFANRHLRWSQDLGGERILITMGAAGRCRWVSLGQCCGGQPALRVPGVLVVGW